LAINGETIKVLRFSSTVRGLLGLAVAFAIASLTTGCGGSGKVKANPANQPAESAQSLADYRIGIADQLQVTVWRNPELSVSTVVRPDGKITVPLAGDVVAGGRSSSELGKAIEEKLATYIRSPSVTVAVTELRSHEFLTRVRVTGAVRTPRSMPYRPGMTVLDAVLEAGGPTEFAAPNRTRVYRKLTEKTEVFDIELDDILRRGKLKTNIELRSGDVVTIPERLF
jgi:polysaccharide export outer membrane protein